MQRLVHKYIEPLIGFATDSCIKRRRRLVFSFLLTDSLKKLIRWCQQVFLLSIEITYCSELSSASAEGISKHASSSVRSNSQY
jgi:hypothetical protein